MGARLCGPRRSGRTLRKRMLYLSHFSFPDAEREFDFFLAQKRTCHDSYYPFQVLSQRGLQHLDLEPVTILYGGNGTKIKYKHKRSGLSRPFYNPSRKSADTSSALQRSYSVSTDSFLDPRSMCPMKEVQTPILSANSSCVSSKTVRLIRTRFPRST